jgi:hypothetical protein
LAHNLFGEEVIVHLHCNHVDDLQAAIISYSVVVREFYCVFPWHSKAIPKDDVRLMRSGQWCKKPSKQLISMQRRL